MTLYLLSEKVYDFISSQRGKVYDFISSQRGKVYEFICSKVQRTSYRVVSILDLCHLHWSQKTDTYGLHSEDQ